MSDCPKGYSSGAQIQSAVRFSATSVGNTASNNNVGNLDPRKCYATTPSGQAFASRGGNPHENTPLMAGSPGNIFNPQTKFYELEESAEAIDQRRADQKAENLAQLEAAKAAADAQADPFGINDMTLAEAFLTATPMGIGLSTVMQASNTASEQHMTGTGRTFAQQDEFNKQDLEKTHFLSSYKVSSMLSVNNYTAM